VEGFFLVIAAVIVYALVAGWDGGTRYRPQRLRRAVWMRPCRYRAQPRRFSVEPS
jgi:hypothetical protein